MDFLKRKKKLNRFVINKIETAKKNYFNDIKNEFISCVINKMRAQKQNPSHIVNYSTNKQSIKIASKKNYLQYTKFN